MIGELLSRLAKNETLNDVEIEELKRWGNQSTLDEAYVRGLQSGRSELYASDIRANSGLSMGLIYSKILSADTTSVTVNNIPQKFRHLLVIIAGRNDEAVNTIQEVSVQFNGDTGNNYIGQRMYGEAASGTASAIAAGAAILLGCIPGDSATAGYNGSLFCFINHYRSSFFKGAVSALVSPNSTNFRAGVYGGFWNDTSAITTVKLFVANSKKFKTGTSISIHGVQ